MFPFKDERNVSIYEFLCEHPCSVDYTIERMAKCIDAKKNLISLRAEEYLIEHRRWRSDMYFPSKLINDEFERIYYALNSSWVGIFGGDIYRFLLKKKKDGLCPVSKDVAKEFELDVHTVHSLLNRLQNANLVLFKGRSGEYSAIAKDAIEELSDWHDKNKDGFLVYLTERLNEDANAEGYSGFKCSFDFDKDSGNAKSKLIWKGEQMPIELKVCTNPMLKYVKLWEQTET